MAERAAKQLELNKSELPNSITEVIATLSRAGFEAYIVGGGVRDTLLGLKPKDFDAVTDAKPHEIKDVFGKRCRIIGRRFQLAHVYSGRELIEVATFRGPPINDASTNQDGMILRDNVWGDIKQDFARRDFSINALYYQPLKGVVHDFCGALNDIDNKIIRLLGNAPVRIEEDPVRLLRALRFKAKLGFEFDDELAAQFNESNWALLEQISPHRLYDETQKMFTGGYLEPLLPLLFESGAIDSLIIYPPSEPNALVKQVAINTDKRINAGKSINPAFFYAALLWENYLHQLEKAKKRNMPFADAQMQAAGKVIERQRIKTAIPKFAEQFIRDIWLLQPKLAAPRSKQIEQLAEHPRFRAGFDFLLLREQCGDAEHPLSESTNGMGEWWQNYQTLSLREQQQAINDFDENIRRGAHKRGRNRQPRANIDNEQVKSVGSDVQATNNIQATSNIQGTSSNRQELLASNDVSVNNASNVPARRRRRADNEVTPIEPQSKAAPVLKARNSKRDYTSNKRTPQAKHDSNELALLQQLSLSKINSNNDSSSNADNLQSAQPAPLFVIEHGNVVPPLKKQLAQDKVAPSETNNGSSQTKAPTSKQAPIIESPPQAKSDTIINNRLVADEPSQAKPSETKPVPPVNAYVKRSIAQSPQLVTIDNEPIPYKRRRRQPSTMSNKVPSTALPLASVEHTEPAVTAKYEKKIPKPAHQPKTETRSESEVTSVNKPVAKPITKAKAKADRPAINTKPAKASQSAEPHKIGKASKAQKQNSETTPKKSPKSSKADVNKASVNKADVNNADVNKVSSYEEGTNKGPVPAKRRRRQPSTDR